MILIAEYDDGTEIAGDIGSSDMIMDVSASGTTEKMLKTEIGGRNGNCYWVSD